MEHSEAASRVHAMAAMAGAELLEAYGVKATRSTSGWIDTDDLVYSGVMGFVGDALRGSCLLTARPATLLAAAPADARPRDWVGELANQFVGRLKSKLLGYGVSIAVTTPIALSGIRLSPLPRSNVEPVIFETDTGRVLIWLELEVDAAFELGPERPISAAAGDLLVF